jgi:hypothetical protein
MIRIWIRILLFRHLPSRRQQKNIFFQVFLPITVPFEGAITSYFKDKVKKKSQNSRNQGVIYYFCLMMEGSGSGSGSIPPGRPKTYGSDGSDPIFLMCSLRYFARLSAIAPLPGRVVGLITIY